MGFSIIYITHPDKLTAQRIANELINKRLVACANIFPIDSSYWWKGEIHNEGEYVSIVKTRNELVKEVEQQVLKIHPYEVPCIMSMKVDANKAYELWILEQTT